MQVVRQPVRAHHRMLETEHAPHVGLVHGPIHGTCRLQALAGFCLAHLPFGGDFRKITSRHFRARLRPRHQHFERARHHERAQHSRRGDIRIGIEADPLLGHCLPEPGNRFAGATEIGFSDHLVVRNDDRDVRLAAHRKTLLEAVEHVLRLVAHVRRIDGAGRAQHFGERDDLALRRGIGRRIPKPGGQADRAGIERLGKPLAHRFDLALARGPIELAHAADAQG